MKTLRLFPNTGHQFFTLDLEELMSYRTDAKGERLPELNEEDQRAFKQELLRFVTLQKPANLPPDKRDKFSGWQPWEGLTWILYQYGEIYDPDRNENRPVLHLAIESNLGDFSRGSILQLERARGGVRAARHPFLAGQPPSASEEMPAATTLPYVSRDLSELRNDYKEGEMWLEDPLGGGRMKLPSRLDPRSAREFNYELPPETVKIQWMPSSGDQPVEVDACIDLGNTRTIALLLEDHGTFAQVGEFGRRAHPVRFLPRGMSFAARDALENVDEYSIIDSWVLVHRSSFANLEPPASQEKIRSFSAYFGEDEVRAKLVDQRFVSLSPVLVGGGRAPTGAAKTLARAVLSDNPQSAQYYLSSPKRYAWDDISIGKVAQHWEQIPNEHDADAGQFKPLGGLIRTFMHPGGEDFDLPVSTLQSPGVQPFDNTSTQASYPRRDTVCWFALAILEAAHSQMNSPDFLEGKPRSGIARRLRKIRVTYPAGWTGEEREAYLSQWRRAARLFSIAHLENPLPRDEGGDGPIVVSRNLDEAVSSQLPILFSELRNLGHDAFTWFDLYGPSGDVTVMNIDIGGGTTDIAVIRYSQGQTGTGDRQGMVSLRPQLLYKDGCTVAGDVLVKRLIERIVLPAWLSAKGALPFVGNTAAREIIASLLTSPGQNPVNSTIPNATARLGRVVRLALVPLANEVLRRLTLAERDGTASIRPILVSDIADSTAIRELNNMALQLVMRRCEAWGRVKPQDMRRYGNPAEFKKWFDGLWTKSDGLTDLPFRPDAEINITVEALNNCVTDVFGEMIASLSDVVADNECNLVIVSGKPSELPQVRRLVTRELPLPAQRVIQVKDFPIGDFYPAEFLENGRIRDAKTVTVAGAALFQDVLNGNMTGFDLTEDDTEQTTAEHNWGVMLPSRDPRDFQTSLLFESGTPAGKRKTLELPLQSWIGRSLRLSDQIRPEPVYRLSLSDNSGDALPTDFNKADATVRLTLMFNIKAGVGECIEIVPGSVQLLSKGAPLNVNGDQVIRLRLCTLVDDTFWLDAPSFEVASDMLFAGV